MVEPEQNGRMPENDDNQEQGDAYRYANTRPFTVFVYAASAALAVLLVMWWAWQWLDTATREDRIADPPDLKGVVERIETKGREIARDGRDKLSDAKGDRGLASENAEDDEPVDDAVDDGVLH